jgi:hypothetical protein
MQAKPRIEHQPFIMKMHHIFFIFGFLMLCLLSGCNESPIPNTTIETLVFEPEASKDFFDFATITDTTYQIIPLETSPDFLIGEIEKIDIKNNKIIVFDWGSRAIFLFNLDGTKHKKIFKPGRGPGEYGEISAMGANDSSIIVFDNILRKLLAFDFNGELIQETSLPNGLWATDIFSFNNTFYLYASWHQDELGKSRLFSMDGILDQDFKAYLPFDERPLCLGNSGPSYSLCNNNASLIYSGCDTVFSISKEGKVAPSFVFDFKGKRAKYPSGRPELVFQENDDDKVLNIQWIGESDRYFFPSISRVGDEYYMVYDKIAKDYHLYNFCVNLNISRYFPFYARRVIKNQIILTEYMFNMHHIVTDLKADCKLDGFYNATKSIVNNSSIEDNPVVFIFNLKN